MASEGNNYRSNLGDSRGGASNVHQDATRGNEDSEYLDVPFSVVVRGNKEKNMTNNNKRKRERTGPDAPRSVRPIKGFSNKTTRELSVQGLSNDGFESLDEIEDSVRAYCQERKIERVFRKKHEFKTVGCKIAVRENDANTVMSGDFWPEDMYARKWHPGNKNRQDGENGDSQSPD